MRTAITLDDDVAALLEKERRERGASLRDAVNKAIGEHYAAPRSRAGEFRTTTASLGRPRVNLDDVAEALDFAEGDDRR